MEIRIGIAKAARSSADESSETVDVIERPSGGGYSIIICGGTVAAKESKPVSFFVANKISTLLSEGVRDSTAIRATSDQLFTNYNGLSQATLNVISVDLNTDTIVISRNNPNPIYYYNRGNITEWSNDSKPIGSSKHIQPSITEIPIEAGSLIILVTEGVFKAGSGYGQRIDLPMLIRSMVEDYNNASSQGIADFIMNHAIQLDLGKPQNDMCVMILRVVDEMESCIRRFTYTLPIDC